MIQVTFMRAGKDTKDFVSGFYEDHATALANVAIALDSEDGADFVAVLMPRLGRDLKFEDIGEIQEYSRESIEHFASLVA